MKITVIGFYGGYPYNGQATSSYLVQSDDFNLLLDCGSGALIQLEKVLDPLQLDAVILSHYHADHIADVGVLQHYWQLNPGIKKEPLLPIYGHTLDMVNFKRLNWPNSTQAMPYETNQPLDLGPFRITFLPVQHPVDAFAMRIVEKNSGKNFVFTADTRYFSELVKFVQDTDLMISDTNFLSEPKGSKWHLTVPETGKIVNEAHVKRLLMSHLPQNVAASELVKKAREVIKDDITVQCAQTNLSIIL